MSGSGECQSFVDFLEGKSGKKTTSSTSGVGLPMALIFFFEELLGTSGAEATDLMGILGVTTGRSSEAGITSLDSESEDVAMVGIAARDSRQDHSRMDAAASAGSKAAPLSESNCKNWTASDLCG